MTMCVSPIAPEAATTLRLTVSKAAAVRHLKLRIGHGVAIRRRRVRYVEDLAEVRAAKAAWVLDYSELLRQLFHGTAGGAVADACNDWVGRVYPEYAEIELFVEQFYEEMEYRITRLRDVARQVAEMPEHVPAPAGVAEVEPLSVEANPIAAVPAAAKRDEEPGVGGAASTGLLVVKGDASQRAGAVGQFLRDLGIDVVEILTAIGEGKLAVAALERNPSAAFAVLLLRRDEAAAATFELGYLVGRLGLARVCVLHEDGVETPPESHGVPCLPLDPGNGWHLHLARQLKRAGVEVDLNKLC